MVKDTILVTNPATGRPVKEVIIHDEAMFNFFVRTGREAQTKWEAIPLSERLKLFKKLKRYIWQNHRELIAVIQSETGKVWPDAMIDVLSAVVEIYHLEKYGESALEEKIQPDFPLSNKEAGISWEPDQLVGVISPWNLPLAIPVADIFPAILGGSAVIWKPSEYTPLTALKLEEIMRKVGFPASLLKVLLGYGEAGAELCEAADYISFTGSCRTGEKVREICERRGIPKNLEMGGKAPAIVLPDANIERTAYALVYGAFSNNGHYCKSFERVYVHRAVFNEVVDRVLRLTDGLTPGKDYGPIITRFQLGIIKRQIEEARNRGAYVATGGQEISGRSGNWYRPTVLLYVDHSMSVMREETFGPVMPIMPFDKIDEAVKSANDSHLGLNASIFTRNKADFFEIKKRLKAGNIVGNDAMINWFIPKLPQCGRKSSTSRASGRMRHGQTGIQRYNQPKSWVWHGHPLYHLPFFKNKEPWWLPYNNFTNQALKIILLRFSYF